MNQRLLWADNAKALGMFLVFWGHFIEPGAFSGHSVLHEIHKGIYAFHMPFFFILSGFLFHPKPQLRFGSLFVDKVKNRLVPVIFFVVIASVFRLFPFPASWKIAHLSTVIEHNWLLLQGKPIANWVCWFLICLFSVELMANELILGLSKKALWMVLPLLYWFAYSITKNSAATAQLIGFSNGWWFLQEAMMGLVLYLCGYLLAQQGLLHPDREDMLRKWIFLGSLIVFVITYRLNFSDSLETVNMSGMTHGDWRWFLTAALAGSIALIYLGGLLPSPKLLIITGRNTLPLIGLCGLFLHLFNAPLWIWLSSTVSNEWLLFSGSFVIALLSLLVALPIAALMSRYLPVLVGRWK